MLVILTFKVNYYNVSFVPHDLNEEVDVPKRIEWTEAQDLKIRRMRAESASWDNIAVAVGVTRWTAIERGRRLGARLPPPGSPLPAEDPERPPLPPGHPETWGAMIKGMSLEGMPYPIPAPIR
jgi:hypothetical protein